MTNSSPGLVSEEFTKNLPKIELHAHLSGSITRECLHDIWLRKKAQDPSFSLEDPLVLMPPGEVNYDINIFFDVFSKSIYNLVTDTESIMYATKCVLNDFRADGVRYLELRTTLREIRDDHGKVTISREEYVLTVLRAIDEFKHEQKEIETESQMSVYLILSIDRWRDTAASAEEVVNIAIKHRNYCPQDNYKQNPTSTTNGAPSSNSPSPVIVGIDLCGNPLKGTVSIYEQAIKKAKSFGLGITLHFAEIIESNANSSQELETLLSFSPDRLGHVIYVPDDIACKIMERKIALELCMSCNVHAKMIKGGFEDHHFGYWWGRKECAISLCTDDVGFFCSPVSQEYYLASRHFGLSRADLIALCEKGYSSIFGGEAEKARLRKLLAQFSESNV